jgi:hypothetical protein
VAVSHKWSSSTQDSTRLQALGEQFEQSATWRELVIEKILEAEEEDMIHFFGIYFATVINIVLCE